MKIDLIRDEEGCWEGLYLDGELVAQGHSLSDTDVLDAMNLEYRTHRVDLEAIDRSDFPKLLVELPVGALETD